MKVAKTWITLWSADKSKLWSKLLIWHRPCPMNRNCPKLTPKCNAFYTTWMFFFYFLFFAQVNTHTSNPSPFHQGCSQGSLLGCSCGREVPHHLRYKWTGPLGWLCTENINIHYKSSWHEIWASSHTRVFMWYKQIWSHQGGLQTR